MAAAVGAGTGGGAGTVGRGRTGPPGALSATAGALVAPHARAGSGERRAGADRGVEVGVSEAQKVILHVVSPGGIGGRERVGHALAAGRRGRRPTLPVAAVIR